MVLVVVGLLSLFPITRLMATPNTVTALYVDNQLEWTVNVDVAASPTGARLGLGTVPRGNRTTYESVLDQGDSWVIVFEYAGVEVPVEVSRRELAAGAWAIEVPGELGDRLADADIATTPLLDSGGTPQDAAPSS